LRSYAIILLWGGSRITFYLISAVFRSGGYLVFYQPFDEHVDILRVLHGSRDVERIFDEYFDDL